MTIEGNIAIPVDPSEPPLSVSEKEIRDKFVAQYLFDHDYVAATIRLGFDETVAAEYGRRFAYDPYVQRRIAESMQADPHDDDAVVAQQRRVVLSSLFREANYKGHGSSHGARVAALAKLSAIHGMEAPTRTEVNHKGGQTVTLDHNFDFEKMTKEQLGLIRQLLESEVPDDGS
jgi:hypothetical protein